jgi:hypothetical protein
VGTGTPLSLTAAGVTARFTSPSDSGAFVVDSSFFGPTSALTGLVLFRPEGAAALNVGFSSVLTDITLAFATIDAFPLTLQAFQGSTLVGSVNATGTTGPGRPFFQGMLAFSGAAFDNVRFTAPAEFAIDNVRVSPASVIPEPATVALLGMGLGLAGVVGARRKRRAAPA